MSRLVLGVIGHVDHGKTALVRALTGMETDRLPEERARGISIALGFAHAAVDGVEIDFVDMPGHERFVRTMVSGATGIGAVLLVVAANEGIKPQTVEHVEVAALLGVARAVIAVTKADLVTPESAAEAGRAAADLAARAGLDAAPPVRVCAPAGTGLDALRAALAAAGRGLPELVDHDAPWLPVDRAFTRPGHGTVVTGTLRRGRLEPEGDWVLAPAGIPLRLRGLQVHGTTAPSAPPGSRVAVNLRGVELAEVPRGCALARPGRLVASDWLTVELRATPDAAPLAGGVRLQLLYGTDEVEVRVRLLDRDVLAPGAVAPAQLHLARPAAVPARERFILRRASPPATVGGGRVLDPEARRLRRSDPAVLARLRTLAEADADGVLAAELEAAGARGAALDRLARLAGVSPDRAAARLADLAALAVRGDTALTRAAFEAAGVRTLRVLDAEEAARPGPVTRRRLGALLPEVGPPVLDDLLARLAGGGRLRVEGGAVRLVRASQEAARGRAEAVLRARLAEALRRGGLSPPDPDAEGPAREVKRAVDALVREGLLVRTYDRVQKREIVFHREAVEAARRLLAPLLTGEGLLVKEAGAALGVSRKFSVPLLEHLDAVQFTRREGDRRVLGRGAAA